jgi:hypothetical protein
MKGIELRAIIDTHLLVAVGENLVRAAQHANGTEEAQTRNFRPIRRYVYL